MFQVMRFDRLKWAFALLAFLSTSSKVFAVEYEIGGVIKQTLYNRDGSAQFVREGQFTLFVRDCSWLIQSISENPSEKRQSICETGSDNGFDIYEVTGSLLTEEGKVAAGRSGINWNVASVISNSVPVGTVDDYYVAHLWLMFASDCYFQQISNTFLVPVYDVNASVLVNPRLTREASWELIGDAPSLPFKVTYLLATELTNAAYYATGVTNIGKIKLASGFVFEQWTMSGRRLRKRAEATVTTLKPFCSRDKFRPLTHGTTVVVDRRLDRASGGTPASYTVRDGNPWLAVGDAKKLVAQREVESSRKPSPVLVRIVLGALALVPLLIFVLKVGIAARKG